MNTIMVAETVAQYLGDLPLLRQAHTDAVKQHKHARASVRLLRYAFKRTFSSRLRDPGAPYGRTGRRMGSKVAHFERIVVPLMAERWSEALRQRPL